MSKLSKKKINLLITGGTGFLGKSILKKIDKNKFSVTLLSRKKVKGFRNLIVKDIFNLSLNYYLKILKKNQIVLHLAWYTKPGEYFHSLKNLNCLDGSIRLAKACKIKKVKKFIGIGTCLEYKNKNKKISTSDKLSINSIYSGTKILLYNFCKDLFYKSQTNFIWCRIFYLYGKGEPKKKLVSYVLSRVLKNKVAKLSGGSQIKDFIHVEDASNQIIEVIKNNKYSGSLNICSGQGKSVKKFINEIVKKIKKEKYLLFNAKKLNKVDPNFIVGIKSVKI